MEKKQKKTQLPSFYCILLNARAGEGEGELGIELDRIGLGIELGLGLGTELGLGIELGLKIELKSGMG